MEEWNSLKWKVDDEGLDYTLRHYSSWEEIKDEKFHELRNNFIQAAQAIESLIEDRTQNEDGEGE